MAGDGGVYGWHFWGGVLTLNKYFLFEKRITWQHIIYTLCPRKQMNMFNHTGWKQSCLHTQSQRRSNLLAQTTIQWQVWTSAFPFSFLPLSALSFFLSLPSLPPFFLPSSGHVHMHVYMYQFSSVSQLCPALCDFMDCSTPGFPVHHQLLELAQTQSIELVMPSNHLILCCPLLFPPSMFPSIRVFSNESVLRIRWPKYWSFSFSISPSNEYSGLISFRRDWFDLLARTLKSLLQHHSCMHGCEGCESLPRQ